MARNIGYGYGAYGAVPQGNAFIVRTPALDQLQQHIYQQQQQRQLYQQQQNQKLDEEFSRNLAGIRDADVGDLTKTYGTFKMAYQNMLRQKGGVSPDQQLDVLRKKADVYDVINKSKERKAWEDAQAKQIMTDRKGYYADDAHDKLLQMRQTPLSKLDTSKDQELLYPYSMPDLDKELKNAQGQQKEVSLPIGVNKDDPMKDDTEVYKVGNSPNQFYNNLLQGIVAGNKGRNFAGIVNGKHDDASYENLKDQYNAIISSPKYIAIHGQQQPLNDQTDLGKAVATETMENVVNNPLIPTQTKSEINQQRKQAQAMADWQTKAAVRQQQRKEMAGINLGNAKWLKQQPNYKDLEGSDDDVVSTNKVIGEVSEIMKNGTPSAEGHGWVDVNDPTILKEFKDLAPSTTSPPSGMRYNPQTNQMKFVYQDQKGNESYQGIEPSSYLKYKVKQTYPGKDIGKINNAIGQLYENSGGRLESMIVQNDELAKKAALQPATKQPTPQPQPKTYSQTEEQGIQNFMKANKLPRDKAVKILVQAGRLK